MTRLYWIAAVVLVLAAWGAAAAFYPQLPAKIPTHWNLHGKIDGYGPKGTIFIMPAAMTGMLGLFALLPALSPKSFEVDASRTTYLFVMVAVIALFGYMHGVILYATVHGGVPLVRAFFGGMFLFFALVGNVLGRVRRNFYIGVRVPWTLASERVWNDTHRLAAWLMVAGGLTGFVMLMAGLPLGAAIAVLGVVLVVPVVYSFIHYKQLERRGAL
jgi:uncharacterized membrane protein